VVQVTFLRAWNPRARYDCRSHLVVSHRHEPGHRPAAGSTQPPAGQ
jgi:hypothetical protein